MLSVDQLVLCYTRALGSAAVILDANVVIRVLMWVSGVVVCVEQTAIQLLAVF